MFLPSLSYPPKNEKQSYFSTEKCQQNTHSSWRTRQEFHLWYLHKHLCYLKGKLFYFSLTGQQQAFTRTKLKTNAPNVMHLKRKKKKKKERNSELKQINKAN